jgi:hypothetical protein
MRSMRPVVQLFGVVIITFFVAISIARYHLCVQAVAWHCLHGDHTQVAGHTITLPILWWAEKDPLHWDSYLLKRACTGMLCLQPEIKVTHVIPAYQSQVKDSDQETLELVRSRVSAMNARPAANSRTSAIASLVTIKAKSLTLYCSKVEVNGSGRPLPLMISVCSAPRIPYSFEFFALPHQQEEDKSILSTFD